MKVARAIKDAKIFLNEHPIFGEEERLRAEAGKEKMEEMYNYLLASKRLAEAEQVRQVISELNTALFYYHIAYA
ncbi:MAG: hypothetical protein PHY30_02645 [Candidatus Pacebacteria bacterium]|nr:hypothetical protein [Candidatus Paceibacterota bacterium]